MTKKIITVALCALMTFTMLAACKKSEKDEVNIPVSDIWTAIVDKIGADNMGASTDIDDANMTTLYGISTDDIDEHYGSMPMMNIQAEEYMIVKAKEGKLDTVKAGMEKRKADLEEQWKQYLPDVYEYVKKAEIVENGNYVMFVCSPDNTSAVEAFNDKTAK